MERICRLRVAGRLTASGTRPRRTRRAGQGAALERGAILTHSARGQAWRQVPRAPVRRFLANSLSCPVCLGDGSRHGGCRGRDPFARLEGRPAIANWKKRREGSSAISTRRSRDRLLRCAATVAAERAPIPTGETKATSA